MEGEYHAPCKTVGEIVLAELSRVVCPGGYVRWNVRIPMHVYHMSQANIAHKSHDRVTSTAMKDIHLNV